MDAFRNDYVGAGSGVGDGEYSEVEHHVEAPTLFPFVLSPMSTDELF